MYGEAYHDPSQDRSLRHHRQRVKEYADAKGLRISQAYGELIDYALDEKLEPSEMELRRAYRENAEQAREVNREWQHISHEANQYLGDAPEIDAEET